MMLALERGHPISPLPPSNLLNVTPFGYAGDLFVGLTSMSVRQKIARPFTYSPAFERAPMKCSG
jgi:hypothetical protein